MSTSRLIRWAGPAAMLLSGLFLLGIILTFFLLAAQRGAPGGLVVGSAVALSLALVVGIAGFPELQKGNYGRTGRAGAYTVFVALLTVWLGLVPYWFSDDSMGLGLRVLVVGGLLGLLVGFVLYGAATLQAGVFPRWCGVAFIGPLPATVAFTLMPLLGQATALIVFGLVWLALGYALWIRTGAPTRPRRLR